MKNFTIMIALLFTATLSAQQTQADAAAPRKWQFGISFSPDFGYRVLHNSSGDADIQKIIDQRNVWEIPKIGYTTGLYAGRFFNEQLELESGVLFASRGFQTKEVSIAAAQSDPSAPRTMQLSYADYYLSVPVKINYFSAPGKLRLYTSAGISGNFFLNQVERRIFTYSDGHTKKQNSLYGADIRKFNMTALLSVGLEGRLSEHASLRIAPVLRYDFISITDAPVKTYLWSVGFEAGFYF